MAKRHWLWDAYVALTQQRAMTEDEAMGQLESVWPTLPVRAIVRAEGNVNATLADVIAADELARQTQGSGNGQPPEGQRQSSTTQGQQQEAQQGSGTEGQDFNAMLRARAGRGHQTTELSRAQIMAAGTGKPADDVTAGLTPEPDFIRAAVDRKRGG